MIGSGSLLVPGSLSDRFSIGFRISVIGSSLVPGFL